MIGELKEPDPLAPMLEDGEELQISSLIKKAENIIIAAEEEHSLELLKYDNIISIDTSYRNKLINKVLYSSQIAPKFEIMELLENGVLSIYADELLLKLAEDPAYPVRAVALETATKIGNKNLLYLAQTSLASKEPSVRADAAIYLAKLGEALSTAPLENANFNWSNLKYAQALAITGNSVGREFLFSALNSSKHRNRAYAAAFLYENGDSSLQDTLVKESQVFDDSIKNIANRALAESATDSDILAHILAKGDPDSTKLAIKRAIKMKDSMRIISKAAKQCSDERSLILNALDRGTALTDSFQATLYSEYMNGFAPDLLSLAMTVRPEECMKAILALLSDFELPQNEPFFERCFMILSEYGNRETLKTLTPWLQGSTPTSIAAAVATLNIISKNSQERTSMIKQIR